MMPPPVKGEPRIGSSIPLEVISEHCCSARAILKWNHGWASVSQLCHLQESGTDTEKKMVSALKKTELELGRQVETNYYSG